MQRINQTRELTVNEHADAYLLRDQLFPYIMEGLQTKLNEENEDSRRQLASFEDMGYDFIMQNIQDDIYTFSTDDYNNLHIVGILEEVYRPYLDYYYGEAGVEEDCGIYHAILIFVSNFIDDMDFYDLIKEELFRDIIVINEDEDEDENIM
jgi:hypothetical protein